MPYRLMQHDRHGTTFPLSFQVSSQLANVTIANPTNVSFPRQSRRSKGKHFRNGLERGGKLRFANGTIVSATLNEHIICLRIILKAHFVKVSESAPATLPSGHRPVIEAKS